MQQPGTPTPVLIPVAEQQEDEEHPVKEGNQVEPERKERKTTTFEANESSGMKSVTGRLKEFMKKALDAEPMPKTFSIKHQVQRFSGYFIEPQMEKKFLRSRLGGRRWGFLLLSIMFICIESLDWGLGASSKYETDLEIARKCLTLSVCVLFFFISLFFWRAFHYLEKVMAGAITFWVFSLSLLREEILTGFASTAVFHSTCGHNDDLFFNEAAIMTLTTAFTVCFIISVPLRRPLLFATLGSVAAISVTAEIMEASSCRLGHQEAVILFFFVLCEIVVFAAVAYAVLSEEFYLRALLTTIGHQKTRIANLVDERDDLLKAKGGTSSVERLVNLLKQVAKQMRAMEQMFLAPETSGVERQMARELSGSVHRMIKDLNEATQLASNAEQLFDVDISGLLRGGRVKGSQSRRRSARSITSADQDDQSSENGIASFLNANFLKTQTVLKQGQLNRRMTGASDSIAGNERTVERQVTVMLVPVFKLLPQSLAEPPSEVLGQFGSAEEEGAQWDLDLRQLQGVEVEGHLTRTEFEAEGGEGNVQQKILVKMKNALPIVGLHLLRPHFQEPLGLATIRKLTNFLTTVEANYTAEAPYHNALHGADVALMTVWLTQQVGVRVRLTPLQNLTVIVAALCHDLGHDGVNNLFHSNSESAIAQVYNDRSILENFHCAQTFRILKDQSCNFLENLDKNAWRAFRSGVIDLILDTDMKGHFQFVSAMKLRVKAESFHHCLSKEAWNPPLKEATAKEMEQDLWLVTRACLKAADLGHSAKSWEIHKKYSFAVTQEFFAQGDLETSLDLPVSPLCSREGASAESLCKSQSGFLSFVCKELFVELSVVEMMARNGGPAGEGEGDPSPSSADFSSGRDVAAAGVGGAASSSSSSFSRVKDVCLRNLTDNVARWGDAKNTAPTVPLWLFDAPKDKRAAVENHPVTVTRERNRHQSISSIDAVSIQILSSPPPDHRDKPNQQLEPEKGNQIAHKGERARGPNDGWGGVEA
uniref:Phosphodiesterase n=1 Tax=Chromera velia CCMP2878 TaxID=1169474 RepID=A0A0G4HQG8_9ALVE|eukprot:Cvel_7930.t1-p1 / transcript=Cvel_7930.t1 / gene=Cvel_7930 / organism=Chromera_velia_CCMP2878 / gene_product=Probable 3',5'-cyclic phosphodiesterase pde-1, putative / transcript_product=Probable 3',5'-cyclic phosphodiesterase pde-1, putative / location=Cvel_scaffold425:55098-64694(+) / protein_length=991 / sequence_SO=supercontig / SO=protein_coding / is_pseudo=false